MDALPLTITGKIDRKQLEKSIENEMVKSEYHPPKTQLEQTIADCWKTVLGLTQISRTDNFFEVGGHSLVLISLLEHFRNEGIVMELKDLFRYQTVEQVARHIETENLINSKQVVRPNSNLANQVQDHILTLEKGDPDKMVFVIPGSDGLSDGYAELARTFKGKATVFGIQMLGLYKGEAPLKTIEAIARLNIEWIRSIQPEGPYRFIGHSFGALVAFEMTKQLEDQDQKVEQLGLLDMSTAMKREIPDDRTKKAYLIQRLTIILEKYKYIESNETTWLVQLGQLIAEMEFEDALPYVIRFVNAKFSTRKTDIEFIMQVFSIVVTNAFIRYEAEGMVKAHLMVGKAEAVDWSKRNASLDWDKHAESVTSTTVSGDHFSMVKGENILSFVEDYYSNMMSIHKKKV